MALGLRSAPLVLSTTITSEPKLIPSRRLTDCVELPRSKRDKQTIKLLYRDAETNSSFAYNTIAQQHSEQNERWWGN
jgi:hypothetical protein